MSWADGKLEGASILSLAGNTCKVRIAGANRIQTIKTLPGKTYSLDGFVSNDPNCDSPSPCRLKAERTSRLRR